MRSRGKLNRTRSETSSLCRWLEGRGYQVIRFRAGQVERNLEGVLEMIRAACEAKAAGVRKHTP